MIGNRYIINGLLSTSIFFTIVLFVLLIMYVLNNSDNDSSKSDVNTTFTGGAGGSSPHFSFIPQNLSADGSTWTVAFDTDPGATNKIAGPIGGTATTYTLPSGLKGLQITGEYGIQSGAARVTTNDWNMNDGTDDYTFITVYKVITLSGTEAPKQFWAGEVENSTYTDIMARVSSQADTAVWQTWNCARQTAVGSGFYLLDKYLFMAFTNTGSAEKRYFQSENQSYVTVADTSDGQPCTFSLVTDSVNSEILLCPNQSSTIGVVCSMGYNRELTQAECENVFAEIRTTYLTVPDAPTVTYGTTEHVYTVDATISDITTTSDDGVSTYTVQSGSLPTGLALNSSNGTISGTPTVIQVRTAVTIRATNVTGTKDNILYFTIEALAPPTFTYSVTEHVHTLHVPMDDITVSGDDALSTYTVQSGSLPEGLSLNSSNGTISGTPAATQTRTAVTIRATNDDGTKDVILYHTVGRTSIHPPLFTYPHSEYIYTIGDTINISTGSDDGITEYTVSNGALPNNVSINASNGNISGTPDRIQSRSNATIIGRNKDGAKEIVLYFSIKAKIIDNSIDMETVYKYGSIGSGAASVVCVALANL